MDINAFYTHRIILFVTECFAVHPCWPHLTSQCYEHKKKLFQGHVDHAHPRSVKWSLSRTYQNDCTPLKWWDVISFILSGKGLIFRGFLTYCGLEMLQNRSSKSKRHSEPKYENITFEKSFSNSVYNPVSSHRII